mgnify:CR=1 FL=1|jgi:dTDP-4-dehydrorhamnose reductase
MVNVLVLGSKGFLGSVLIRELQKNSNYNVQGLNRDNYDFTHYLSTKYFISSMEPDIIINCATQGGKQKLGDFNKDELINNLKIHRNLMNCRDYYGLLINIGSGAEFDITTNIENVREWDFCDIVPSDSYGLSKNIISNDTNFKCLTLRLFMCFDYSEPSFRLLKRYLMNEKTTLTNLKKISFISAIDFCIIVKHFIDLYNWKHILRFSNNYNLMMNCAYLEQMYVDEILDIFSDIHKIPKKYEIESYSNNSYTCNTDLLYGQFNEVVKKFEGFESAMRKYSN